MDTTGTGNSLLMRHPHVLQMIMDSLRYWVLEMHVDGFRFDLARSEEHTSELQSLRHLVCRLLLEKKQTQVHYPTRPPPPQTPFGRAHASPRGPAAARCRASRPARSRASIRPAYLSFFF